MNLEMQHFSALPRACRGCCSESWIWRKFQSGVFSFWVGLLAAADASAAVAEDIWKELLFIKGFIIDRALLPTP